MKRHDGQLQQPRAIVCRVGIMFGFVWLAGAIGAAHADIDSDIAARVAALEEVLDRLEFDADRIDDPPAYQQANKALSGDLCMAFTAQGDMNWNLFKLDADLTGEGEAEVPSPINFGVSTAWKGKVEGGPRMGASGLLNFSGAMVYRQCIKVIPWAILGWYKAWAEIPGHGNFPEVVPGEVFETPFIGEARQAPVGDDTFDALSADARAFLVAAADQLFAGLDRIDDGTTDGLSFLQGRIDSISQDLDVSISDVIAPAAGLGTAILPDPAQSGTTFGSVMKSFSAVPEKIAGLVPFAPDFSWLTDRPLGVASLEDLDYCAVLDDIGVINEIPVIYDFLDLSCVVRDLVVDGTAFAAGKAVVDTALPDMLLTAYSYYSHSGGMETTNLVDPVVEGLSTLSADANDAEQAVWNTLRKTVNASNFSPGPFPITLKGIASTIASQLQDAFTHITNIP